jgi:trehalose-6-phosphate hydrolase
MEKNMTSFPTLFFGSHDMPRMIDRLAGGNADRALALAALMLTAKGVPFIYYGEEIGMHNIIAQRFEEIADIQGRTHFKLELAKGKDSAAALIEANNHNRDKSRGPMQWNGDAFAGFSTGKTWIKISPDYKQVNVRDLEKKENSMLSIYKKLIRLRNNEKVLQYGQYERLEYTKDQILFTRSYADDKITVIINFGAENKIMLPAGGKILLGNTKLRTNSVLIYRN